METQVSRIERSRLEMINTNYLHLIPRKKFDVGKYYEFKNDGSTNNKVHQKILLIYSKLRIV